MASLLVAAIGLPQESRAQVTVRDSLGAPVPFAILEAPDGRRAIAGADGIAAAVSPANGPWSARRIGYRPGRDDDGDGLIVLARMPLELVTQLVRERSPCAADRVASRSPGAQLEMIRTLLLEGHERRAIVGAGGGSVPYNVSTTLVTVDGRELEGDATLVPVPVMPSSDVWVAGQAVRRIDGEWVVRRPRLVDVAADGFLGTHCVWVEDGDSDATAVIRFEPAREVKGANISGAFVVQRVTGRILSDTLVLESPPKGAPGAARFVATYADATFAGDPIPIPKRIVERIRATDLHVRLDGQRVRIAETIRVFERVMPEAGRPER